MGAGHLIQELILSENRLCIPNRFFLIYPISLRAGSGSSIGSLWGFSPFTFNIWSPDIGKAD